MLDTKLTSQLLRTKDSYIVALEKAGIKTVKDMLLFFPRDHEDRSEVLDNFSLINLKEKNTLLVTLVSLDTTRTSGNKILTKGILEDANGFLAEAVWFNRKYLASQLKVYSGKKVLITGKAKYNYGKVIMQSPEVETDLSKQSGGILPIYSDAQYIPGKWIESKMYNLRNYIQYFEENLPEEVIKKYNFISRSSAIEKLHFPAHSHDVDIAKYRLSYEELYRINYKAIASKHKRFDDSEGRALSIPLDSEYIKEIFTHIPFELTGGQKMALFQVLKDMEKTHSMQRLLEGDVGTGKTVVSLIATIHAIRQSERLPLSPNHSLSSHTNTKSPHPQPLSQGEKGVNDASNQPSPPTPLPRGEVSKQAIFYSQKKYNPEYIRDLSRELRKTQTSAEEVLWEVLRDRKFNNLKFRRQHAINRYIADFYCHEIKLVIELDGKIHKNQKEYDDIRDKFMESGNYTVLRFSNDDVFSKLDYILESIVPYIPLPMGEVRGGLSEEQIAEGNKYPGKIQVAIMAPTEILARQHFQSMEKMLIEFGLTSHLLVGSTTDKQKKLVKADLKSGNVDVVIGTHALLQETVSFANLGFVVIDEQHRFGVKQREVLEKGWGNTSGLIPHNLNMTATPIPRTLALTLYGDQDLSIISEYPKGRKTIHTKVAKNDGQRAEIELFIRNELEKGRQVFWISPLVEESEKMDLANAISTHESLVGIFHPFQVGLLHGKMKAKEKESIMKDFSENKIQVLSSTSVVEVGVDVPNATIMCIEGAERFGLSQLHQFRGRVGRGKHQSYCYLFPTSGQPTDRLKAMEQTNNGFELSEIDLEIRGPGEVYGVRQSGLPDLKIADITDLQLVSQIREDIEGMFNK